MVAFVSLAAGSCLQRRCPETALVYLRISRSLHSNGSARYNTEGGEKTEMCLLSAHVRLQWLPVRCCQYPDYTA
jgi:hypothetical protein